jgi:hypothetical protein
MANTIYAAFADPGLAEKAAGALLDHGARNEDISVLRSHDPDRDKDHWYKHDSGHRAVAPDLDNTRGGAAGTSRVSGDPLGEPRMESTTGTEYGATNANLSETRGIDETRTAGYGTTGERVERTDYERTEREDRDNPADEADVESTAKSGITTTTAGDAGSGAVKGAGVGLGVGALAALWALFVPGIGLVLGGGALAAALGGVAAATGAGAVAGGVTGYLKDQGVDDHVAEDYDRTVQSGGALLAISLPTGSLDEGKAREILDKYGATNVNSYATRGYMA